MIDTDEYRKIVWDHLATNLPGTRLAYKKYGRFGYKYTTVKDYAPTFIDKERFNHRNVLHNELVADFDCDQSVLTDNVVEFTQRLSELGCSFSVWRTNGDSGGVHIHTYWDIPENVRDAKLLKRLILEYITPEPERLGLDAQLLGNHLIRFEGGDYDKLPAGRANRKTLKYIEGEPLQTNKVPQVVWDQYSAHILKYTLGGLRRKHSIEGDSKTPKSIQFILSAKFKDYKDGGKRALFILASHYRKTPEEDLFKLLRDWAKYNTKEYIDDRTVRGVAKRAIAHQGRQVGETYRKEFLKSIGAYNEVYGNEKETK